MNYPTLPSNSKAINIISRQSYSSDYDIVWSFDYAISGNSNTEAGFTVFLATSAGVLSGGNGSIDLGYSGLSAYNLPFAIRPGVSGGYISVGFDTTGLFAASATIGTYRVRDGLDFRNVKKNSITLRGGSPGFSFNSYNYHEYLSSISTDFQIVSTGISFKTIRCRLGNVGRTIYVDYKARPEDDFTRLLEQNITNDVSLSAYFHPGISFVTPVSSNNANAIGNIYIRNFHVEGSRERSILTNLI